MPDLGGNADPDRCRMTLLLASDLPVRDGAGLTAAGKFAERIWKGAPVGRGSSALGTASWTAPIHPSNSRMTPDGGRVGGWGSAGPFAPGSV